jgi:nicotinate-nucleotide pyrophosphorylase (carboxylating)
VATAKPSGLFARRIADDARRALAEDVGDGDLTAALVPEDTQASATVIAREPACVCGRPWFEEVFHQMSHAVVMDWRVAEGEVVSAEGIICELRGPARVLLTGERTALNFLQLLSAVATRARAYTDAVAGTTARILDTRKTIPGLRLAQKYAVTTGGAENHRTGLFDGVLIKENHIAAAGGIQVAVEAARATTSGTIIEVEVENLDQCREALAAAPDRLLLDNFSVADLRAAVEMRNASAPGISLEASGGVTVETVHDIAQTGVEFISVGSLTKDIRAIDLSMQFSQR